MAVNIEFPQITAEPLASVLRALHLKPLGPDHYEANCLPQMTRIYGGQVLAQALLAACETLDEEANERVPHSFHAYFLKGGSPTAPIDLKVRRLMQGRSFASRQVSAFQDDVELFTMLASFQKQQDGVDHALKMPDVPAAEELRSAFEIFRTMQHPVGKFLGKTVAFDVRHVQSHLYTTESATPANSQQVWMRPRAEVPNASAVVARILLAYVIDQVMMEPALRSHGLTWLTPGLALASIDHAMHFYRDFDINDWLLYDLSSPSAQGSRAVGQARVFTADGTLVAAATQEAMLRLPPDGEYIKSKWTFDY
ncbi:putative acyl-CoA thioesterase II [Gleimia coleocanis DSM 15436]|uniref:Putative acyl-CoA thioesterase II n=1 Tax=Gleimia coleocanis DSM 15436 TaxID=525245 RepID=C0W1C0_9ACTO|nr:acyl-CoA thioesterase domain-containing protein [Gleimia coleocanis]EEH63609.1 putative acyl-CoA thioesterase II [Gleimia coleocanis DSM 15436]